MLMLISNQSKAEAITFTCLALFNDKVKILHYQNDYAANNALKRVLHFNDENSVFIRKPLYNSKAEIPFLDLSDLKRKQQRCIIYILLLVF